ncbi:MAG: type II toxin-antitoxin system VapC family toxin [Candidatus Hydrothermarchaeales archaeon]
MELRYIDSSLPLCVMTGEPREYYSSCLEIMEKVEKGEETVVTSVFTVAEIGHILKKREKLDSKKTSDMTVSLLDCQGLKLLDVEAILCRDAIELSSQYSVDFVDAYNVLTMKRKAIEEIYSLDEHYDIFKDVKRVI